MYVNCIIVCNEDEIKGMLKELTSKVFSKTYKKDRYATVPKRKYA